MLLISISTITIVFAFFVVSLLRITSSNAAQYTLLNSLLLITSHEMRDQS